MASIRGLTFAVSDQDLDLAGGPEGLIVRDTRHVSRLELRIDGARPHALVTATLGSDGARLRAYLDSRAGPDPRLEVVRTRRVLDGGMHEEIRLRSWREEPTTLRVELAVDCDFADIFEVRRPVHDGARRRDARVLSPGVIEHRSEDLATRIEARPPPDDSSPTGIRWDVTIPPRGEWSGDLSVRVSGPGSQAAPDIGITRVRRSRPAPSVETRPGVLAEACARSEEDIAALSMRDPRDPRRRLIAAGLPWFVALFGRDSLIVAHQLRAVAPGQMLSTLQALAARQGQVVDPGNEEEPGKILHEVRMTTKAWLGHDTARGARPYFGSVDATPLFLILLGEAWRWGADRSRIAALIPAARAAVRWMRTHGDADGDGLIEYRPQGDRSLVNQGWKDSTDAIQWPDGGLAVPPIALCEVQGYAIRGRREFAAVLAGLGHDTEAADLEAEADALRDLVRERYWMPAAAGRPGAFALALDGEKRQVPAIASNMGHLLWCDVPSPAEARQVADHLVGPGLASGWGLRTLSREMAGYNPLSYHVGSVWPHDTAIVAEGLRRQGLEAHAVRLVQGLLAATEAFGGRLPELFGGHARSEEDFPVPYPTACRPQAWAAGVPPSIVATLLGLRPDVPAGRIVVRTLLPPGMELLAARDLPFPTGRLSLEVDRRGTRVDGVPDGMTVELSSAGPV